MEPSFNLSSGCRLCRLFNTDDQNTSQHAGTLSSSPAKCKKKSNSHRDAFSLTWNSFPRKSFHFQTLVVVSVGSWILLWDYRHDTKVIEDLSVNSDSTISLRCTGFDEDGGISCVRFSRSLCLLAWVISDNGRAIRSAWRMAMCKKQETWTNQLRSKFGKNWTLSWVIGRTVLSDH